MLPPLKTLAIDKFFNDIKHGNIDKVSSSLLRHSFINNNLQQKKTYYTPMMVAFLYNQSDIIHILLKSSINWDLQDYLGNTLLHLASFYNQINMIEYLLAQTTVNVNISNKKGYTPIMLYITGSKKPDQNILNLFLIRKADIAHKAKDGSTILTILLEPERKDSSVVHSILKEDDIVINKNNILNSHSPSGLTPLTMCLYLNIDTSMVILERLLALEASPNRHNIKQDIYETPLHKAVSLGTQWKKVIDLLLSHKADVSIVNKKGEYPLMLAMYAGQDDTTLKRLLSSKNVNGNTKEIVGKRKEIIPIMATFLTTDNSKNIFSYALTFKPSTDIIIFGMKTNLIAFALAANRPDELSILIKHYKSNKIVIDLDAIYAGNTLLVVAAMHGSLEMIDTLVKAGANINARGKNGLTVLFYTASVKKNYKLVEILLDKYNADPFIQDKSGLSLIGYIYREKNKKLEDIIISRRQIAEQIKKYLFSMRYSGESLYRGDIICKNLDIYSLEEVKMIAEVHDIKTILYNTRSKICKVLVKKIEASLSLGNTRECRNQFSLLGKSISNKPSPLVYKIREPNNKFNGRIDTYCFDIFELYDYISQGYQHNPYTRKLLPVESILRDYKKITKSLISDVAILDPLFINVNHIQQFTRENIDISTILQLQPYLPDLSPYMLNNAFIFPENRKNILRGLGIWGVIQDPPTSMSIVELVKTIKDLLQETPELNNMITMIVDNHLTFYTVNTDILLAQQSST